MRRTLSSRGATEEKSAHHDRTAHSTAGHDGGDGTRRERAMRAACGTRRAARTRHENETRSLRSLHRCAHRWHVLRGGALLTRSAPRRSIAAGCVKEQGHAPRARACAPPAAGRHITRDLGRRAAARGAARAARGGGGSANAPTSGGSQRARPPLFFSFFSGYAARAHMGRKNFFPSPRFGGHPQVWACSYVACGVGGVHQNYFGGIRDGIEEGP